MKNKRMGIRLAAAVLVLGMFAFAGCGKTEAPDGVPVFTGEKTVIATEVLAGYSIVRPDSTGEDGVRAGVELRDGLMAASTTTSMISRAQTTTELMSSTLMLPIYRNTTERAAMMAEKAIFLDSAI